MLSHILDRISFWSLFLVIVLLPAFVLPFTKVPIETSKGLLLVVGLGLAAIFWTMARFFDGEIVLPKSSLLLSGFGIVFVFLLSAIFSGAKSTAFFGVMLDVGSFWFMFAAVMLMFFSALITIKEPGNAKTIFLGLIISSSAVLLFQTLHLFFTSQLSLGILGGRIDNLFGSWNAFGILAGFSSIISLFLLEFFLMSRTVRLILGLLVVFSTLLVATVNFSFIWILLGISALLIFVYKISFYSTKSEEDKGRADFPIFSLFVMMVALLFFMSGQSIAGYIPNRLGLVNIDVSPSVEATGEVMKAVLAKDPILGMGPNRFADAWALHKPASVNISSFWDVSFNSGSGLLPTFAATTGALGIISLLVFFGLFLSTGLKSLFSTLQNGTNQEITAFFVASLYLFISAFFYSTGPVVVLLAFALAGIFVGLFHSTRKSGKITFSFLQDPRKGFFAILILVFLVVASAALLFKYIERFASVSHFRDALSAQTIPESETSISKALMLHTNDLYLRTYALIYVIKMNSLLAQGSALPEEQKTFPQESFKLAVLAATKAIEYNKENYVNYKVLGSVYEAAAPVGTAGTYEKALEAYQMASSLNPSNPGLKLAMARVSFANKKIPESKEYANQALSLKGNYIDALLTLSQIATRENNRKDAIAYAETALTFAPTNKDLIKYVTNLKNGNSSATPPATRPWSA